MATTQTPQSLSSNGVTPTMVAADATGHKFRNTGKEFLLVYNAHATVARIVTVTPVTTERPSSAVFPSLTVPNIAVSIPALTRVLIGPFPSAYNDADGNVNLAFSASGADLTLAVGQLNAL